MPLIPFPDVPITAGVPALPRKVGAVVQDIISVASLISATLGAWDYQRQWGIYDSNGKRLGESSSFVKYFGPTLSTDSVEYSKETKIADFPIERGGFASYNKTEAPANPMVTLCMAGSEGDRTAFLKAIDAASKSLALYNVVTPEVTYIEHSIERYNYQRRADHGATLLIVELSLREIRQVQAQYTTQNQITQAQDQGATATVDSGKLQPETPKQSVAVQVRNALSKFFGN